MFNNEDWKKIRLQAALDLARHKMEQKIKKSCYPSLDLDAINELFVVAGCEILNESELNEQPEVQVLTFNEESEEKDNDTL